MATWSEKYKSSNPISGCSDMSKIGVIHSQRLKSCILDLVTFVDYLFNDGYITGDVKLKKWSSIKKELDYESKETCDIMSDICHDLYEYLC